MKTQLFRKLTAALTLFTALTATSLQTNAGVILSFDSTDQAVGINETFTVDLIATPDAPIDSILGFGLDINLDSSVLAFNGFTLNTSSFMPGFSADGDMIAGAAMPAPLFAPTILLGTFEFTAIGTGLSNLATSATAGDLNEGVFTTNFFNASLTQALGSVAVVSEPVGVVFAGLVAMMLMRLRRNA